MARLIRFLLLSQCLVSTLAFLPLGGPQRSLSLLRNSASITTSSPAVTLAQNEVEECIKRGKDPRESIHRLECLNQFQEPNRSPDFLGEWHVWYTGTSRPSHEVCDLVTCGSHFICKKIALRLRMASSAHSKEQLRRL
jgi:hypothetical protein